LDRSLRQVNPLALVKRTPDDSSISDSRPRLDQVLELKVLIALISTSFFLDSVPSELDTDDSVVLISRQPVQCYINPVRWNEL
jgi:hypothetical protein